MIRSKRNQKTIKLQTSALLACLVSGAICGAPSFAAESSADPPVAPPAAPAFRPITGRTQSATLKTGTDSTTLQTGTQSTTLQTGTQSTTLQTGLQSTTLQTGTQSTTLQTGTGTTTLQTGTGSTLIQSGAQTGLIQGGASREAGPINILFLLDCSFSMKEGMGDKIQKMDAAKTVLQQALARIPADVNLGMRVFGQGYTGDPIMDCHQSALLVPIGQGNRRSIIESVRQIHPYGLTPLEYALRQAAESDLSGLKGPKTLILISDGADTCGGNPCEFVKQLPRLGIKLKVDIVGLNMKNDKNARNQLNCITETSGGKYYDATTAAQMIESISNSINTAISGRVMIKQGAPAANLDTPVELQELKPMKAPAAQPLQP